MQDRPDGPPAGCDSAPGPGGNAVGLAARRYGGALIVSIAIVAAALATDRFWQPELSPSNVAEEVPAPTARELWNRAVVCRQRGDLAAALEALDQAVELDPGNLQYLDARHRLQQALGR